MTEKVINSSAASLLILILPIAILIVVLFKAWPLLLALFIISISIRIWQQYQWNQWSKQVNPYFNQLIKENQGCLTAVDLSMKANLSAAAAQLYLEKKAEEFGAQRRNYAGKGTVYYFLTASALGSIFEDSEPLELEDEEDFTSPVQTLVAPPTQKELVLPENESLTSEATEVLEPTVKEERASPVEVASTDTDKVEAVLEALKQEKPEHQEAQHTQALLEALKQQKPEYSEAQNDQAELEPLTQQQPEREEAHDKQEDLSVEPADKELEALKPLIQAELAKRLDVHSSTVGKRKSDEDFPEWSQSRDPEGIAWAYNPETKEFLPVEKIPELE